MSKRWLRDPGIRNNKRGFQVERLEPRHLLAADVYISEFLASNNGGLLDEDGDDSDWVEVFNAGPDDVNLGEWYLTDDDTELKKWQFPSELLAAGSSLVVFASGKDRAVSGEQLHANFRLSAGGEYLALTQEANSEIQVISEFAPEFPEQVTNVAYGITQDVSASKFVTSDSAATLLIPTQEPSASWNALHFNDSDWRPVTAAIGYQATVPGFTVQDAASTGRIQNLSEANALLDGTGQRSQTVAITPVINFRDVEGGGGDGRYSRDLAFPNNSSSDDNDFAIRATGTITIPETDTWTFGTNSDDGVRLRINGELVIDDDTLHAPQDRIGQIELQAGLHQVELTFFERGGGAEVELFARQGARTRFSSAFDLVGDVDRGGLAVHTSPSGGGAGFAELIRSDVGGVLQGNSTSAYLRIPFQLVNSSSLEALNLQMHYNDGFVAYLNGTEVARRNAPAVAAFDSTATAGRRQLDSLKSESINVADHLGVLKDGLNVLAIHGLNEARDSEEFLIVAELAEFKTSPGEAAHFRTPSPGSFNPSEGVHEFLLNDIAFDHPHGFYDAPFELAIASESEGTRIRYTTDGSVPTEENGLDYARPVPVGQTTTIRARSFKDGTEPSNTETATYIFLSDVVEQSLNGAPPEDWPDSRNINGQVLDYGMARDIVNSRTWGRQMEAALTQIPSMSVVMDIEDFVGRRGGIYTHAQSHGKAWERPASLELIHPDGSEGFQTEMGIRIRGGFSRRGANPKHAFRLFFRDEYGDGKLDYPLFGDEGAERFDKVDLRTAQNYAWSQGGSTRNTFLRDVFSRDVQREMGQPYTRSRFYHLYINGEYWGLFQTQERSEARYAASYFGGDPDDYDVVKSSGGSAGHQNEATDGNLDAYRRLADFFYQRHGLGDRNMADYWRVQGMNEDGSRNPDFERLLDVDNLIDYMVITYFTSDADGPGSKFTRPRVNNYFGIFNRKDPDGFKFFEHDSEHSLDTGNAAGANYNMVAPLTNGGSEFRYFNPHWMHEQLARRNTVYRERFADAVYRHLFNDGVLSVENARALIDARAAEIDMAIIAESARWGDFGRASSRTKDTWENAVETVRNWFDGRAETVLTQLRRQGWYPNINPPQFTVNGNPQHGGNLAASDNVGFALERSFDFERILPTRSTWRYLDDGSNQRTAWREPDFDDSQWESGRAQLGYGGNGERTEIGFGPDSQNKFRTTYFRTTFDVDNPQQYEAGLIRLVRDDGAVVYLNGEEIIRSNMPSGRINYRTLSRSTVGGSEERSFFEFDFPTDLIRDGENTIAVEVHQTNNSSSDLSFELELQLGVPEGGEATVYYTTNGDDPRGADGEVLATAKVYNGSSLTFPGLRRISARGRNADGTWSPLNSALFAGPSVPGDLDLNGEINAADIDALALAIRSQQSGQRFDVDGDGGVDEDDFTFLVETIIGTKRGDTNLDGRVDFADFLVHSANFAAQDVGWASGNFDTDDEVSFTDFLVLSANFGFQQQATIDGLDVLLAYELWNDEVRL